LIAIGGPFSRAAGALQIALAGARLDEAVGLEDPRVREPVVDGAAVAPGGDQSGRPQDGEVLAHVRDLAPHDRGEVAHGDLAVGQGFEDAQALRIGQGPADDGRALVLILAGGRRLDDHVPGSIAALAQSRK
jgi:hypothetical protein